MNTTQQTAANNIMDTALAATFTGVHLDADLATLARWMEALSKQSDAIAMAMGVEE